MHEVLSNELAQYRDESADRVAIDGPSVDLKPAAALSLGLIVHELATNAMKYGALSDPKGRVAVNWDIHSSKRRTLTLTWSESRGPAVKKSKHRGFGTELIEREVAGTLGGEATFDYAAKGLQVRISMPLDAEKPSSLSAEPNA